MKKYILILLSVFILVPFIKAQEKTVEKEKQNNCNYWTENWFVEAAIGAEILFAPDASVRPFGRRISPGVAIAAGKWINPFLAVRLQIKGFQMLGGRTAYGIYLADPISNSTLFGNNDPVRDYVTIYPDGTYRTKFYYQNTHLDIMVSIMNLIYGNFSPEHKWDAIPSVGIGYMTVFPHKGTPTANMLTTNFGVQGKYRINDNWDVNLSLQYALFSDLFDSRYIGKNYAGNLELSAGVTYNIFGHIFDKKTRDAKTKQATAQQIVTHEVIREVVNLVYDTVTINVYDTITIAADGGIRDTILINEPVTQTITIRDTIRIAEVPANIDFVNTALGYILFNLGAIRPSESIELQCINTVHFLKQHPNSTITLFGYGDKETGTEQVNLRISQERADYIKQILVQKYNVNPDRIQTKAMGCSVQPYQKEGLNRLVVIRVNP